MPEVNRNAGEACDAAGDGFPATAPSAKVSPRENPAKRLDPTLESGAIRRIICALIRTEQDRLARSGRIGTAQLALLRQPSLGTDEIDRIAIDEETLGFDSLSVLDLVLSLNRFFDLKTSGAEDYLLVERTIGAWMDLIAQHIAHVGAKLTLGFQTSGSSGPPKSIHHPAHVIAKEVAALCEAALADPPPRRVLALVPAHHIYGFIFTCALPSALAIPVRDLSTAPPGAVFRHAKVGDLIIATPFHWHLLARQGQRLPCGIRGVSSGSPSCVETWAGAERLGLDRLTEIYGATETSGIGMRTALGADFTLLPHLDHHDGQITGPAGPLDLQDNLEWTAARHFRIHGRCDDVVQVGGVNVSPAQVRDRIMAMAQVDDAAVRHDGDRLKAFVVPASGVTDLGTFETTLRDHLARELPPAARPQALLFGPALPRNALGKLCDWTPGTPSEITAAP